MINFNVLNKINKILDGEKIKMKNTEISSNQQEIDELR